METIKYIYRTGLIGFLAGGAIGSLNRQAGSEAPAIWVASNAVGNGYQGAGVGLIVGAVLAIDADRRRRHVKRIVEQSEQV
jgi:hypothetical protein